MKLKKKKNFDCPKFLKNVTDNPFGIFFEIWLDNLKKTK